jgi:inner membrane protein
MDSATHILLGGALAQFVAARRLGWRRAFFIGAIAATLPDADVFIRTGSEIMTHALHRHFTHALVMVPVLAALATALFWFHRRSRPLLKPLFLTALLACLFHTLLDALTSYGTMMFWPFSPRRVSLDIVAVFDLLYILPLIFGIWLGWRYKSHRLAAAGLILSFAYLGLATWQHQRAVSAQRQLLAARHVTAPEKPRVLPQVPAIIAYRSIYIDHGQIVADAIRVPPFATPTFKSGGTLPLVTVADLHPPTVSTAAHDFAIFAELADGFVARTPGNPLLISDQRYTYYPEGPEPVWGLQLENTDTTRFLIAPRYNYFGKLLRSLLHPQGYTTLPLAHSSTP